MSTLEKIHIHNDEALLHTLLAAWIKAIERYLVIYDRDNCWWYNERATLSTLAGAAWSLKDWVAIEEFSTAKHAKAEAGVEAGVLKNGRCDLVLSTKDVSFAIESKQAWQPIGSRARTNYMQKAQEAAWGDCWHLTKNEGDRRFAVTFVVPTLPMSEVSTKGVSGLDKNKIRERLDAWLAKSDHFRSAPRRKTSYAYLFPDIGNKNFCNDTHHYPGVVVIFEEMPPGTKRPAGA
ncbi:hypothetical protein RG836_14245 [Pseudomonas sp. SZMC_28357]|uniref:hypothetical protein n=1 Tax=Pseudomonas sp. SZMC_28357 TaxID=3074380 RepID=UPI0028728DF8|nr:hypothetical protein [Pseudomonas sp. SZMC_28357]MDR9752612.1 hypothetical protein [Pseudomonas sp. SZMC_28357]